MSAVTDNQYSDFYTSTAVKRQQEEREAAKSGKVSHTDFLKLLTTQLSTQDPLNPMQDIDFTAQLAQLQALDEQIAMTKSMAAVRLDTQLQAGSNMIGKYVSGVDKNGEAAAGLVTRVLQKDSSVYLELANKQQVEVSAVSDLWNDSSSMANDIANSGNVIGMWVNAGYDEAMQPIQGIVEQVKVVNGQVQLILHNGKVITWNQVKELRAPTDDDIWNSLPEDTRNTFDAAKKDINKVITYENNKGEQVSRMVANVGIDDTTFDVYYIFYDGEKVKAGEKIGEASDPTAEDMAAALTGMYVSGLDSDSNKVSGVVVGAVQHDSGIALKLANGKEVFFEFLEEIRNATDAEKEAAGKQQEQETESSAPAE